MPVPLCILSGVVKIFASLDLVKNISFLDGHYLISYFAKKFDLNPAEAGTIEDVAVEKGLTVLGRIPFDPVFTRSMVQGQTIFEYNGESEAGEAVKKYGEKQAKYLKSTNRMINFKY